MYIHPHGSAHTHTHTHSGGRVYRSPDTLLIRGPTCVVFRPVTSTKPPVYSRRNLGSCLVPEDKTGDVPLGIST